MYTALVRGLTMSGLLGECVCEITRAGRNAIITRGNLLILQFCSCFPVTVKTTTKSRINLLNSQYFIVPTLSQMQSFI